MAACAMVVSLADEHIARAAARWKTIETTDGAQ
jgi:hypothetical protein